MSKKWETPSTYRKKEVNVFMDVVNLINIFKTFGSNPGVIRNIAHKLIRWKINLSYRCVIENFPGENNVWADMISRWAAAPDTRKEKEKMVLMYTPIDTSST